MTNHCNYARWMSHYFLELQNLARLKPDLKSVLENGGFTVRRSNQSFSRIPVDLTLEQTINADAKNKLTGLSCFSTNDSATQKWLRTRGGRLKIVSHVLETTGLKETVGARTDTRPQCIKKDNEAIDKLKACFNESMNPFTDGGGKLRNIKTGLEVSEQVEKYMINIRRNCFVSECMNDHNRFEAPLKKVKISNFASDTLEKSSSKTAS